MPNDFRLHEFNFTSYTFSIFYVLAVQRKNIWWHLNINLLVNGAFIQDKELNFSNVLIENAQREIVLVILFRWTKNSYMKIAKFS